MYESHKHTSSSVCYSVAAWLASFVLAALRADVVFGHVFPVGSNPEIEEFLHHDEVDERADSESRQPDCFLQSATCSGGLLAHPARVQSTWGASRRATRQ
mmetsp:Transcript_43987/g.116330  ORF Transcript_43987/g.116330 Transcript_43987/m.116330 type:complete len:100 (-) Transcript_43987:133-432(-)